MSFSIYEIISKKRDGKELSKAEIEFIINGYVRDEIPEYQMAAILMAIYIQGLNKRESSDLTEIMMNSGDYISFDEIGGRKIDKHSTGGVGDKISFIVCPIVASCGVKVPMLSGRALGHTGGTLDKLESIPGMNVFLSINRFKQVLGDVGMVVSGQTENIVPADRKLYALRDSTATVGSIPLITSSIMSKKLALGTDGIVLDVKTGKGAFIQNEKDSILLCKTMVDIGEKANRKTIGVITNMNQPLGKSVGNALEIIESIESLKGNGPDDVMDVTYALGASMIIAAGIEKDYSKAIKRLKQRLNSGEALEIFRNFIKAQGGNDRICDNYNLLPKSKYEIELRSRKDGYVSEIDAFEIGMAAVCVGAGRIKKEDSIEHSAGFVFNKKEGDKVKKDEILVYIHTNNKQNIEEIKKRVGSAIRISSNKILYPQAILYVVDKNGVYPWNQIKTGF